MLKQKVDFRMKMDSNPMLKKWYSKDMYRAVDAKFEAQKLAFAPLAFQAVRALRDFGTLGVSNYFFIRSGAVFD